MMMRGSVLGDQPIPSDVQWDGDCWLAALDWGRPGAIEVPSSGLGQRPEASGMRASGLAAFSMAILSQQSVSC